MLVAHPLDNAKFIKMHFAYPALLITYQLTYFLSSPLFKIANTNFIKLYFRFFQTLQTFPNKFMAL